MNEPKTPYILLESHEGEYRVQTNMNPEQLIDAGVTCIRLGVMLEGNEMTEIPRDVSKALN